MSGISDTSATDLNLNLIPNQDKQNNNINAQDPITDDKSGKKKRNKNNKSKKDGNNANGQGVDNSNQERLAKNLEVIKQGDLDVFPPDFKLAEKHQKVLRLYYDEETENNDEQTNLNQTKNSDLENQNQNKQQDQVAKNNDDDDDKQCSCCGRLKIDFKLQLKSDIIDFSFLGPAYPLFFSFLKMIYILILIIFATSGLVNIITNARSGNSCQDGAKALQQLIDQGYTLSAAKKQIQNTCQLNWISQFTLGNRRNDEKSLLIQEYLNLFTILALIVFIQYMEINFRIQSFRIDIKTTTPNDYTVFITQIQKKMDLLKPKKQNNADNTDKKDNNAIVKKEFYLSYKECFEEYLKEKFQTEGKIFRLSFCFNLDELNQHTEDRVKLLREIEQLNNRLKEIGYPRDDKGIEKKQKIIDEIEDKKYEETRKITRISEIQNKCYNSFVGEDEDQEFMRYNFIGQAFLSFNNQKDLQEFLKKTKKMDKKDLKFQGKLLQFEQAPDPTDICWSNLYTTKTVRKLRIGFGFFMNIALIVLAGMAIYGLADVQYSYTKSNSIEPNNYEKFIIQIISLGISIFITVINEVLVRLVEKINQLKKFRMKTSEQTSFMIILCLTQFFNSTVIPLLLLIMVSSADSYYSILYSPTGLILNQNSIFMTNAFLPILMTFIFDPSYRWKQFNRNRQKKLGEQNKCTYTQREAQELFQDPEFQLSVQYATTLKSIFMMFFYTSVMPLCLMWSFIALAIQYVIAKYLLIYRRVVLVSFGTKLSQSSLIILKIGLIIYSSTAFLFFKLSNSLDRPYVPSIIGIVLSVINFAIPLEFISEKLFKIDEDQIYDEEEIDKNKTLSYEEAIVKEFSTDYAIENPALKRKLLISDEYKIDRKSIQKLKIRGKKKVKRNQKNAIEENCKLLDQGEKINIYDQSNQNIQQDNNIALKQNNLVSQNIVGINQHQVNENTDQFQVSYNSKLVNLDIKLKEVQTSIEMVSYASIQNKNKQEEIEAYKENIKKLSVSMSLLQKQNKKQQQIIKQKNLQYEDQKNIKLNDELFIQAHQKLQNYRKHFNITNYMDENINKIITFCEQSNNSQYDSNNIKNQIDQLFDYQDWLYKHFINLDKEIYQSQGESQQNFNLISQSDELIKKLRDKKIGILNIISQHQDYYC
ncbi:transmembrane protein, putative (macronuclear) [Tetrahymena thermophila SB210]|uniref:Transmembrane protein, putative n=1 Tax=Tetrahymena thermophila (strain SB210) TaxID=312017 RepID=Q247X6_TETTS|nr:transmembrane protein, putative [Tetrahymena thermophila SB210]EAS04169.2 transmembrane protein, putative [Tetrahymena thermophila SB210]|eukprot:XP_001024414.2 transmembrane protein, putative [Tetrahymena thermophila SB210]